MTRLKGQRIQVQCGIVAICLFSLGVVMFCSSCISIQTNGIVSMKVHPSPNWNERQCPVSMLVLHYSALPTCEDSLARLCDPAKFYGAVFSLAGDLNGTSALQFACGGEA